MAKSVVYKKFLHNPETITDLINLGACELVGKNNTILYYDEKIKKFIVIKNSLVEKGYMETPDEELSVKTFWNYTTDGEIVK